MDHITEMLWQSMASFSLPFVADFGTIYMFPSSLFMTNPSVSFAPSLRRTVNFLADKAVNVYRRHQTVLALVVACFLVVASVRILFDLVQMLRFIWDDLLNGDALIYLTMGRGILNGLHPYLYLFESKPPGVFYLSAISLYFTNGVGVLRLVEAANLLFLPGICAIIARPGKRMTGFLLGGLLALRSFENAGGLESEIFGILPTGLFVMSLFVGNRGWRWTVVRGLFLLGGIAIREPFLLGMLAAVLLVARSWKDLWELFFLPLIVALVVGCTALLVCGILHPYMTVYLPAMFQDRIASGQQLAGGGVDPTAWRILWSHRLFASLTKFSTLPLLGYVAGFLWFLLIVAKEKTYWKALALTCLAVIGGIAAIHELFVLTVVFSKTAQVGLTTWQTLTPRPHPELQPSLMSQFGQNLNKELDDCYRVSDPSTPADERARLLKRIHRRCNQAMPLLKGQVISGRIRQSVGLYQQNMLDRNRFHQLDRETNHVLDEAESAVNHSRRNR